MMYRTVDRCPNVATARTGNISLSLAHERRIGLTTVATDLRSLSVLLIDRGGGDAVMYVTVLFDMATAAKRGTDVF